MTEVISWAGGTAEDYGELRFNDQDDADIVRRAFAAGHLEVQAGQLVIYDQLSVQTPAPAAPGATVEIIAILPAGTPDTEVTFELAGEAVAESIAGNQAVHLYQFADAGRYLVTVSSAHHGSVTVEVVVQ
ncbi:MAG: hypothetical protein ACM3XN_02515 [Chloroflexota bacterium]